MKTVLAIAVAVAILPAPAQTPRNLDHGAKRQTCRDLLQGAPPLPHVLAIANMCERSDVTTAQQLARIYGRPVPSDRILDLPAHGTEWAKKLGYACISGTIMKRLPNGWEQVRDTQYRYARCRVAG